MEPVKLELTLADARYLFQRALTIKYHLYCKKSQKRHDLNFPLSIQSEGRLGFIKIAITYMNNYGFSHNGKIF